MANPPLIHVIGALVLLSEVVVIVTAITLLFRLWRRGELQRGLFQIVFLEDRRRRFVRLFGLLTVILLSLGFFGSLNALDLISYTSLQVIDPALVIVGAATIFAILLFGLRPTRLSRTEEEILRDAPETIVSMGLLPILARVEEGNWRGSARK
jgi:hypothetical protein